MDEQLGRGGIDAYGSATLTMTNPITHNTAAVLAREWFAISELSLDVFKRSDSLLYNVLTAIDSSIERVHAPTWNNHDDVIVPGWCFAFPPPGQTKYSDSDLREVFELAGGMLSTGAHTTAAALGYTDTRVCEILALGLTLFGLSIFYENDHTVRGTSVERFSSTARLDGLGDCEDIAKESALAFGDLLTFKRSDNIFLSCDRAKAAQFQFGICLATIRRKPGDKMEAHAFGMLIPNVIFPDEMLTEAEKESLDQSQSLATYLCDGVYDCHPTKAKICRGTMTAGGVVAHDEQLAPWNYEHIVSAFVYNKGEVYFTHHDNTQGYGIHFDSVFPHVKHDVVCINALGQKASTAERRQAAAAVLACNLPRATRTFGFETQSPADRLDLVVSETKNRALRMQVTFDSMHSGVRSRFARLHKHLRAPCLSQDAFTELRANTSKYKETAFQVRDDGTLLARTQGKHGSVKEPSPAALNDTTERAVTVGGHSHHRQEGEHDYRECNVPTPEDFISFAARRVWALLNARGSTPVALHKAAIVMTHESVYELNETGQADGIVTCVYLNLAMRGGSKSEEVVWHEVRNRLRRALEMEDNRFLKWDASTQRFALKPDIK
jgi:hypothetical protein